jgi:hypothetical protein
MTNTSAAFAMCSNLEIVAFVRENHRNKDNRYEVTEALRALGWGLIVRHRLVRIAKSLGLYLISDE